MSEFNLDKVIQLLESAHDQGIHVSLADDELAVRFQKGRRIEKKILDELKLNKPFLIHYFKTHANKGNKPSGLRLQKAERNELNGMQLSFAQERLWFIDQLEGSIQYHIPTILNLKGNLNVEALQYAIQQVINRHEVLRTVIRENEGKAWQYIKDKDGWQLNKLDGDLYKQDPDRLQSFIQQLINAPFNLANDYMLRAHLLDISEQDHVLVVILHHIASDGWSNSIIVRELVELYDAYEKRETPDLLPLPIQYADFANWQRQYLEGEVLEKKLLYWKEKLNNVSILQLPIDYERPVIQSTRGAAINFHINKDITEQVLLLSQEQGATLFMTLLAAFNVLLYRYTGQQDICVGTPIAGRDQQELEALIGFFVNSLALRSSLDDELSFIDLLKQVKTTTLEAYDHKELPFEKVVDAVVKERNLSRSPLFQVIFALQNLPTVPEFKLGHITMSVGNFENLTSKYDLAFFITETNTGLHGSVRYCTDLFREETILRMADHFQQLLKSILETPHQSVGSLEMLTSNEKHQLLTAFNDTEVDYPTNKTIIDLFEAQAIARRDAIAVVFDREQLTYLQLNEQSNKLARFLQAKGVTGGTLVAIAMERSPELIVGILGILKAGGAYVPIDIAYPADRLRFMLDDTGVEIILTGNDIRHAIPGTDKLEVISLDNEWDEINNYSNDNLSTSISPESLAYIIYTSGSTGKPKGVMIEHKGVVNLALNQAAALQLTPQITTLQFASPGFDASCYEIFNTLLSGGKLVLPKKVDLSTAENFEACINKHEVHLAVLPPSFLHVIKDTLGTLKTIVSAGEALNAGIANEIRSKGIRLINAYGPTENTVCTSLSDNPVKDNNIVVIGKPISNVQIYILDSRNNLLPVGVWGELCIGGLQLARGYLNRGDLTLEKFMVNPFDGSGSTRLYRSGDLGRWLPDGNIEYLGRVDEQVKLRGYRIELGEIESVLLQSGMVRQAVVLLREDNPGSKRLACYVVPEDGFDKTVLVTYLGGKVPEYMIPSVWVELDRLPLTPNGKIDRKGLPVPEAADFPGQVYMAPRNETEAQLSAVWKELLHVDRVGIDDNFFELGGDSILTIQVVSRCRRLGLALQPRELFIHQTIRRLSAALAEDGGTRIVGEQGILSGSAGLLPIQQWYLNGEQTDISYFNQGVLLGLDKSVTGPWLEESVTRLLEQHDALRFRYSLDADNKWHQEYGSYKGEVVYEDLREQSKEELASTITARARFYQGSLDISRGELVRVVWMETPGWESRNRLLLVIHHLAVDGVSWRILLDDLELLLTGLKEGRPLSPGAKSSSCRQWYGALEQYGKSPGLLKQLPYWALAAKSYEELRVDKAFGGVVKDKDIARYTHRLDAQQTSRLLQEVPRVYHTEINDILLAALASTVGEWQGREEVNIGMEGHGREDIAAGIDLSRTVGWFTGLYPLHLSIVGAATPGSLIKSVKEQLRQLPAKGLGYGVLKYINGEKSLDGPQPWDIVFNYLGQLDNVVRESRLFFGAGESQGSGRSIEQEVNEKISVNSSVRGGELILSWSYSSRHYDSSTIESLSGAYLSKLEELISHCIEQLKEGGVVYTPSDYGLGGEISYEELDNFLAMPVKGQPRREQITGLYRLSGLQQGMLFHGLYEAGIGAYIEQFGCELTGVDLDILRKSWAHLIARHSILRSAFYVDAFTVPVQCVYKEVALPIVLLDYREMTLEEQAAGIKAYYAADKQKGFDFKTAPLMRIGLFRLSEERYRMVWTLHHILFDGWSLSVLMEEFLGTYESLASGEKVVAVQAEEDRYEDYIRYIERSDKEAEEQYWRHYLQGISEHTLLPFIGTTADRNKGAGSYDTLSMHITGERVTGIHSFVQRHHLTLNTLMQGVWAYLLHRYTGNTNIVYGVVVSGRPDDLGEVEQRVGMYINTLPLHSHMNESVELINWLQSIQSEQVSSRQYQHTPLHVLQGWSGVQGDLFDSLLTFENYPVSKAIASRQSSLNIGNVSMQEQTNYPLSIIIGAGDQINIHFSYNTRLLEAGYVRLIRDHFENVLQQFTDPVKMRISDISLLTLAEEEQLLRGFNTTAVAYEQDKSIVDLFEEQVKKSPDALAVVFKETKLSYGELNSRCNQLGHYLRSKGVAAETVVPVCMDRSVEMLVGILGILKAGGAYVPIDPGYPAERIGYMLEDTGATLVLTTTVNRPCLSSANQIEIIELDSDIGPLSQYPSGNLSEKISPAQLAYIIYTSGSTGKPKGVMIEHKNLANLVYWHNQRFLVSKASRATVMAGVGFDALGWEIWPYLATGASLYLVNDDKRANLSELVKTLIENNITHSFIATAILPDFIEHTRNKEMTLQYVLTGGDKLQWVNIEGLPYKLINNYGPTENTVVTSSYELINNLKHPIPPIGKPISNTVIYLLNEKGKLVPPGVSGELYIGGAGLGRGYLNLPELTSDKFVNDFINKIPGQKLYRSGDLGRWLLDGNIEYMGRMDQQVKIRGYRIELGEIEQVVQTCPIISQSIVAVKEDKKGNKRLVGYVITKEKFNPEAIIAYLKPKLPAYMIPVAWVEMETFPLTPNGKINLKALPDTGIGMLLTTEYVAPRTELEEKLAAIWKELLLVERVGINDNFFELGGHSLMAMRMVAYIERSLLVTIPIKVLFQFTCISDLSKYLEIQLNSSSDENIIPYKLYDI